MTIVFDSSDVSVIVTRLSGDRVMCCWIQANSHETVRDFLLRHENVLGGESAAPAEVLTLVNLDAKNAEPFQHDKNFFGQIVSGDTTTDESAGEFSPKIQLIGCVPFVTREVRLFVGIRADASGLLIPALTAHRRVSLRPWSWWGPGGAPSVEIELNYQVAMLSVRFSGFRDLFGSWNAHFSRPDLSKPGPTTWNTVPFFYLREQYCEIFSVMRPTVFVYILRNWILTHFDELSRSSGGGTLMNCPALVGEDILNDLVSICHWPESVVTAPPRWRRALFAITRRTLSQITPGVLDALQKVGILEELKSKLSVEARDMVDWNAKVFKEAFAEELAAEEAERAAEEAERAAEEAGRAAWEAERAAEEAEESSVSSEEQ